MMTGDGNGNGNGNGNGMEFRAFFWHVLYIDTSRSGGCGSMSAADFFQILAFSMKQVILPMVQQ